MPVVAVPLTLRRPAFAAVHATDVLSMHRRSLAGSLRVPATGAAPRRSVCELEAMTPIGRIGMIAHFDSAPRLFDPPGLLAVLKIAGNHGFASIVHLNLLMDDPYHLFATCSEALHCKRGILK
jgi:hypothetical protein